MEYVIKVGNLYYVDQAGTTLYTFTRDVRRAFVVDTDDIESLQDVARQFGGVVVSKREADSEIERALDVALNLLDRQSVPTEGLQNMRLHTWLEQHMAYLLYCVGDHRLWISEFTSLTAGSNNGGVCDVSKYVGLPCTLQVVTLGNVKRSICQAFKFAFSIAASCIFTAEEQRQWEALPYGVALNDNRRILVAKLQRDEYDSQDLLIPTAQGGDKVQDTPRRRELLQEYEGALLASRAQKPGGANTLAQLARSGVRNMQLRK